MTKTIKSSGKRARKIAVASSASVPAMLAIEFHAAMPEIDVDAMRAIVSAEHASHDELASVPACTSIAVSVDYTRVEELDVDADDNATDDDIFALYREALAQQMSHRVAYETNKDAHSCAAKYRKYATDFAHERIARVLYDARVVPDFVNRSERSGYRFNEKTTMRIRDIARFIAKADSLTNYTRAIFASVHAFNKAGIEFNSSHAFACCSASDTRFKNVEHLMTHTREVYGETTQQAQHSMSLNALVEMHALIETRSGKRHAYVVNPKSYVAQELVRELALA